MVDWIVALLALVGLIAFTMVVTVFVNEPDLWVVVILVLAMAIYDFFRQLRTGGLLATYLHNHQDD